MTTDTKQREVILTVSDSDRAILAKCFAAYLVEHDGVHMLPFEDHTTCITEIAADLQISRAVRDRLMALTQARFSDATQAADDALSSANYIQHWTGEAKKRFPQDPALALASTAETIVPAVRLVDDPELQDPDDDDLPPAA